MRHVDDRRHALLGRRLRRREHVAGGADQRARYAGQDAVVLNAVFRCGACTQRSAAVAQGVSRDLRTRLLWAGVRIGGAAEYELEPL